MVNAQYNLLEFFKIHKLFSIIGGSMGGMQVLQFVANFPDKVKTVIQLLVRLVIQLKTLLLMNLEDNP